MITAYRSLRLDEVGKWLAFLCDDVFPGDPRSAVEDIWLRDPEKAPSGVFVALDGRGRVLSAVMGGCRYLPLGGESVYTGIVSGVGTRRDMRGQGLATRLFALCRAHLLQKGAALAHLYSRPDTLAFGGRERISSACTACSRPCPSAAGWPRTRRSLRAYWRTWNPD